MSKRMLIRDVLMKAIQKSNEDYKLFYNPVSNTNLTYPCILYKRSAVRQRHADNIRYHTHESYEITVIDKRVESPVIDILLDSQYCVYENEFIVDNMHHTILKINTGGLANG
uniref:Tail completion protein n=2 Tax=unclassified Caudoviricetes TaxID=2788787 RepID=A0A8S5LTI0_9CAUD|nr:MAG TPA: tail completion protein [Siphoviridae sp. ctKm44]DAE09866.1 MAG TPA: tail completion protein [Siphoviridae sp. ctJdE31]